MSTTDRRILLVDAAIDLIATKGIRALTHRALDTALDLPAGSASYYFRSKRALVEAIADRITIRSRTDFAAVRPAPTEPIDPAQVARDIARWLDRLLTERRNQLITRQALLIELLADPELQGRLTHSLFSVDEAHNLFRALHRTEPERTAADFIAVLEGAVFDRLVGARAHLRAGTPESVDQLTSLLSDYLIGIGHNRAS